MIICLTLFSLCDTIITKILTFTKCTSWQSYQLFWSYLPICHVIFSFNKFSQIEFTLYRFDPILKDIKISYNVPILHNFDIWSKEILFCFKFKLILYFTIRANLEYPLSQQHVISLIMYSNYSWPSSFIHISFLCLWSTTQWQFLEYLIAEITKHILHGSAEKKMASCLELIANRYLHIGPLTKNLNKKLKDTNKCKFLLKKIESHSIGFFIKFSISLTKLF